MLPPTFAGVSTSTWIGAAVAGAGAKPGAVSTKLTRLGSASGVAASSGFIGVVATGPATCLDPAGLDPEGLYPEGLDADLQADSTNALFEGPVPAGRFGADALPLPDPAGFGFDFGVTTRFCGVCFSTAGSLFAAHGCDRVEEAGTAVDMGSGHGLGTEWEPSRAMFVQHLLTATYPYLQQRLQSQISSHILLYLCNSNLDRFRKQFP